MNIVIRNSLVSGVAIIFILFSWVTFEIWKTNAVLEQATDPAMSVERGFENAEQDYALGDARFKDWRYTTPGVDSSYLESVDISYLPLRGFRCFIGGFDAVEQMALNLSDYEYNEYYVTAYNQRLISLLENQN